MTKYLLHAAAYKVYLILNVLDFYFFAAEDHHLSSMMMKMFGGCSCSGVGGKVLKRYLHSYSYCYFTPFS